MMLMRLSIRWLFTSILAVLFLIMGTAVVQSSESHQCPSSEDAKASDFRFQNYISIVEKGSIENMGDTNSIESFLTCHFQGRNVQEFLEFFEQLVDWQNQRDEEEKKWRQLAMQRLVEVANSKLQPGQKPIPIDQVQELATLKDKLLVRSIDKDQGGHIVFHYCHLLPEQIAMRLAETGETFMINLLIGPTCWKLKLLEKPDGSIERVETIGTPFGPWP